MYWHIDTDIIALILTCALYVYTLRVQPSKSDKLLQNRCYIVCLFMGIVMIGIDIAASVVMEVPTTRFWYHLLLTLYLLTLELVIVLWCMYSATILFHDDEKAAKRAFTAIFAPYAVYAAIICSNPWTGLVYTLSPQMEYARAPLFVPLVVGVYALYAMALLITIFLRRRHIPADYPRLVLVMQPVILAVSIPVQLLNAGWLMVLPAYALCLLLSFLFFQDISVRNERALTRQLVELGDHFDAGLVICDVDSEHKARVRFANDVYVEMCEESREGLYERFGERLMDRVHPEDREAVTRNNRALMNDFAGFEMTYRYVTPSGKVKRLFAKAQVADNRNGTHTSYTTVTDITRQTVLQQNLADLIRNVPCGICLFRWEHDELRPMIANERFSEMLGEDAMEYLSNVEQMHYQHVHPDDADRLREESLKALSGNQKLNTTYRSLNYRTGEYLWIRMRGKVLPQEDGTLLVLASYNDVTQEHRIEEQLRQNERELWARYEMERKRAAMESDNLLVRAVYNLSTGETMEYYDHNGEPVPPAERGAFCYSQRNADLLIDDEERARFVELNDKNNLLERFAQGQTDFRLDYRRQVQSGEAAWVRSALRLLRDPRSGDVLLFEYWYDVEEEKMRELTYGSIVSANYESIARIDGRSGRFRTFPREGADEHALPTAGNDADEAFRAFFATGAHPDDRDMAVHNTRLETIYRHLKTKSRYIFSYREAQPDGSVRYKKITQYFIDPQRQIILMLREDVTELIRAETDKNKILAEALETAKRASTAKSQFLSRVSHELRTPLNAIIGFMELARDAGPEQAAAYMSNSDAAARQLLSIINDVLDMSSIESGKLKIAHAPFDFKHLVQSVSSSYAAQCAAKGLAFESRILTPMDDWLVGDQLRVNQILLNLLGNALKFTEEGHVRLNVSRLSDTGANVLVRFEVEDTGCGMSEELRKRLFQPFEQENAVTAQRYGGNGLGLSIVSSLVSMMDGQIHVKSALGKGSVFTVDLPFTKSAPMLPVMPLEGVDRLHVLAVDDDPGESEYTSVVLDRIGIRHACRQSGERALAELARADRAGDPYNVCIVDWKMPEMNGIEIARRIREEYGKEVIVIVASAYEHHQADESARKAGANLFITKPLFQSSLYDLFMTLTGGRIAVRGELPAEERRLPGKRVLLAEDNAMNRMVAEGLLKKLGMTCETAVDGRIAVDKLLASPPGYYDAILMDIQMPNMDGFEATRLIRASQHPDAAKVKIVALTANAFNEDIARSLSSGMNAHVAKPIDPNILFSTLKSLLKD